MPPGVPPVGASDHDRMLAWALRLAAPLITAATTPGGLAAVMPAQVSSGPDTAGRRSFYAPLEALARLAGGLAPLLERQALHPGGTGSTGDFGDLGPAGDPVDLGPAGDPVDLGPAGDPVDLGPAAPLLAAIRRLVTAAVQPDRPGTRKTGALNFTRGQQPLVDAAFLAQAVLRAPAALWHGLPPGGRDGLIAALLETRKIQPLFNNWLLFAAMIEALFARLDLPWDRMRVDYALRQTEAWYLGDGVWGDGPGYQADYYGSYVITPMLSDILAVMAPHHPDWAAMQVRFDQRIARQAEVLERMIGADGSFPPLGRSVIYRAAAFQPLALLALQGRLPASLPPGQARAALMAVIARTLGHPDTFDAGGWLRIGLNGAQPGMAETYISTGSLYLCAAAFLPLGLPPGDRFWTAPAQPWTQVRVWSLGETVAPDVALEKRPPATDL